MKWKIKQKRYCLYNNSFRLLPAKFEGYWYWLCWVTVSYTWIGWRYQKFGAIIDIGKKAKEYREKDTTMVNQ